jgi:hypothetical protein
MTRRNLLIVALFVGLLIAGGLTGAGIRLLLGGLNGQRAQLHQCALATQQAHPNEDVKSTLTHLQAEVPGCMDEAGYEKALDNSNCSAAVWQGDVYCYVPKSFSGKLLFRIESLAGKTT